MIEPLFSSHFGEFQDLASPVRWLVWVCVTGRESFAEPCDGVLTYAVLHVEVMLGHVDVRVTDDALDRSEVNTQGLYLADVGMPAGMGCQHPTPGMSSKAFLK